MADDREIITAVLRGKRDRYAELVERHQRTAWKVAYSLVRNEHEATELSQIAFVKAYERLRQFRHDAKFSTWLYRIIVNECKDWWKRAARRPAMVPLGSQVGGVGEADDGPLFDVADPQNDPSEAAANQELSRRMAEAIERLSVKQRTAFVLHHVQGLSMEETATSMGCRVGTVKAHAFRATEALRERLAPYVTMKEALA